MRVYRVLSDAEKALLDNEHGYDLHAIWRRLLKKPHCEAFESFAVFYNWAIRDGYVKGALLNRKDRQMAFSPENCEWRDPVSDEPIYGMEEKAWINKWNKTVNHLRKAWGMDPLEEKK